jgi:Flp pilus assembly protein TadD
VIDLAQELNKKPSFVPIDPPDVDDLQALPVGGPGVEPTEMVGRFLKQITERTRRDASYYSKSYRAQINLGIALLNEADLSGAEEAFEVALKLDPANQTAMLHLGRIYLRQGNLVKAKDAFATLRQTMSHSAEPLVGLAEVSAVSGDLEEALQLLQAAVDQDPLSVLARFQLATSFMRIGRTNDAIRAFKSAVRLQPRAPFLHYALGVSYAIRNDPTRAKRAFEMSLRLAPGMAQAVKALSKVLLDGASFQAVRELLNEQVLKNPHDFELRELLAWAYVREQNYLAARRQLYTALSELPATVTTVTRARIANNLGVCYEFLKDFKHAEHFFRLSMDTFAEGGPIAYQNLARLYLRMDMAEEAQAIVERCLTQYPEDRTSGMLKAVALGERERYEEAIAQCQSLLAKADDARISAVLSNLLADTERFADAIEVLRKAMRSQPFDRNLINNLAYAYLMSDAIGQARDVLSQVPENEPADPYLTATRGLLRLREGDLVGGLEGYERSQQIALQQGNKMLAVRSKQKMHLELAKAWLLQGNVETAAAEVRKGLALPLKRGAYRRDLKLLAAELLKS